MSHETMARLRRRPCSPPPAPLEDDDLLTEILLRLPPQTSSLPRASAVCKRWRGLVSDPRFCSRFRIRHRRNPPLLGYFIKEGHRFRILGCRHGLVLIFHETWNQLLVWDPVTGDQHRLDIPPGFDTVRYLISGEVLRAAGDVHHFQVVLVGHCERHHTQVVASVYSSETGAWSNLISTPLPPNDSSGLLTGRVCWDIPAVMVGDSLYWFVIGIPFRILEFDLGRGSLGLIPTPGEDTRGMILYNFWVIPAEGGGGLGFLFLSGFSARLWNRKMDCDGVASWVLGRTIALDKLRSINSEGEELLYIIGFAEENNVVLLWSSIGVFTVQLESLQFKELPEAFYSFRFHLCEGVYTADKGIDGGHDGAELPQNI